MFCLTNVCLIRSLKRDRKKLKEYACILCQLQTGLMYTGGIEENQSFRSFEKLNKYPDE